MRSTMARWCGVMAALVMAAWGVGCDGPKVPVGSSQVGEPARAGFAAARAGFDTAVEEPPPRAYPVVAPPASSGLEVTAYQGPLGEMAAYQSKDPGDGKTHPMIVWRTGGFSNSIGDVWGPEDPRNAQKARAWREAGVLMMYPSVRGGNLNPGGKELFYGEVDDVLAAARHAAALPWVDPERVYLGGHSTGGVVALLAEEAAPAGTFRAVFALGPAARASDYFDEGAAKFGGDTAREDRMRAPVAWLADLSAPTLVIEGERGYSEAVRQMASDPARPEVLHPYLVPGHGHFSVILPVNRALAEAVAADTDTSAPFEMPREALEALGATPL